MQRIVTLVMMVCLCEVCFAETPTLLHLSKDELAKYTTTRVADLAEQRTSFDLGNHLMGEEAKVRIQLRNSSGQPIKIGKLSSSCGCTSALKVDSTEIEPGGNGDILASVKVTKPGTFKVALTVEHVDKTVIILGVKGFPRIEPLQAVVEPENGKTIVRFKVNDTAIDPKKITVTGGQRVESDVNHPAFQIDVEPNAKHCGVPVSYDGKPFDIFHLTVANKSVRLATSTVTARGNVFRLFLLGSQTSTPRTSFRACGEDIETTVAYKSLGESVVISVTARQKLPSKLVAIIEDKEFKINILQ